MARKLLMLFSTICAVVCFVYGILIARIGDGTSFFVIWFALSILFLLFGASVKLQLWKSINKKIRYILFGVFFIFSGLFIFVQSCILSGFKNKVPKNLDYIIVLGAQVLENGPGGALLPRLEKAIEYLSKNPKTLCIVTGGQGNNEPFSEAYGMKKYLIEHNIKESRIIMEDRSSNTTENIKNSIRIADLKNKTAGIVTNNFHVYRAIKIAKKCGITSVWGIPCEIHRTCLVNNMLREFFGILKDKIYNNI